MKRLALLITFVSSVSCAQDIPNLLPDSVGAWTRSDSARTYVGDQLFGLIDGGADIFNEYGFKKAVAQRYSDPAHDYIDVEVYEMKDSSSAYGIFSLFTFNTGRRTCFPSEAFAGDGFFLFRKGNYYVSLTGPSSSKDSPLVKIAKEIDGRIRGSGKPLLPSMFDHRTPGDNYETKIAYLKGNLGLYDLTTISFGNDFKVEEGICLDADSTRSFVFPYANEDTCRKSYASVTESLKNGGQWSLVYADRDSSIFTRRPLNLKCVCFKNHMVISTSEHEADLENELRDIKKILTEN